MIFLFFCHRNLRPWSCPTCDATYTEKKSLKAHWESSHNTCTGPTEDGTGASAQDGNNTGPAGTETWDDDNMTEDADKPNDEGNLKSRQKHCTECDKSFFDDKNLKRHINMVHLNLRPWSCPTCDVTYK